jgi:hypothetical protein
LKNSLQPWIKTRYLKSEYGDSVDHCCTISWLVAGLGWGSLHTVISSLVDPILTLRVTMPSVAISWHCNSYWSIFVEVVIIRVYWIGSRLAESLVCINTYVCILNMFIRLTTCKE